MSSFQNVSKRAFCLVFLVGWVLLPAADAEAQFRDPVEQDGPLELGEPQTSRWQAGILVKGRNSSCRDLVGTAPMPANWPEQRVTILEEDVTPGTYLTYRSLTGGVRQLVMKTRHLGVGEVARALVTLEVTRYPQLPPDDTDRFEMPGRRLDREIRQYLSPSPKIESSNSRFRAIFREITEDKEKAWDKVEAIYDWVRQTVEYKSELKEQPVKGAIAALRDKTGDCEDLCSAFIAICRAGDIPARTVWVPEHCYAEFYLVDEEGEGHWFPCQVAGTRAFGGIPDTNIILQKGDSFRVPEYPRELKRYVPEDLIGVGGSPQVEFVRRELTAE